jgi:cytochrome c oxidase cbb3-type subunit 3
VKAVCLLAILPVLAGAASSCRGNAGPGAVAAPPVVNVPVGPLPGPEEADREQPRNPFQSDHDGLAQGRRFFVQYNCAGCHGDHGGGGMGPSLRDEIWLYGSSHGQVAKSIAEGRAYGMPAWERMLTPVQIWQITAYIKSMRTPHEPQAPVGVGARGG